MNSDLDAAELEVVHQLTAGQAEHSLKVHPQSFVVLTRDKAYKVLRRVKLDFADLSSDEKIRRTLGSELEVGQRYSSGVYAALKLIDLPPALRSADSDGQVPVLEMRRLDERRSLLGLIQGRAPQLPEQVAHVAMMLNEFHVRAPARAWERPLASRLLQYWRSQIEQSDWIAGLKRLGIDGDGIAATGSAMLAEVASLIARREAAGSVRELHGDPRPEHIFLEDGLTQLIDPFVLDEGRRIADVLSDLGFLLSDLEFLGQAELARRVRQRYYELTPWKEDFTKVLRFFIFQKAAIMSYNCWLRSKTDTASAEKSYEDVRSYVKVLSDAINQGG